MNGSAVIGRAVIDWRGVPAELIAAFEGYERALMRDDVDALDGFFIDRDDTIRADAKGALVGHAQISAFRSGRGGVAARTIISVAVQHVDANNILLVSTSAFAAGGRGIQSQLWQRTPNGWQIRAAHVSGKPKAVDASVWRVVGAPLVAASSQGALDGLGVAVKDLYAVAGFAIGEGNPVYLAAQPRASQDAAAVAALRAAGAHIVGIAQTDEFAFSIAGRNVHYGTPANPAAPGCTTGGSSSGPAAAVAQGFADVGLGTDTGGSIRVPASYCGLWGLRTTHDLVDRTGLAPLAPRFDTVGWLTRDAATMRRVASVLIPADAGAGTLRDGAPQWVEVEGVADFCEPDVAASYQRALVALRAAGYRIASVSVPHIDELFTTFKVVQSVQAWRSDGAWVADHFDDLAPDVAGRFSFGASVTAAQEQEALKRLAVLAEGIETALGTRIALLPSSSSTAVSNAADAVDVDRTRSATLSMTSLCGVSGRPGLSIPVLSGEHGPAGLCLVGARGDDAALIEYGEQLAGILGADLASGESA